MINFEIKKHTLEIFSKNEGVFSIGSKGTFKGSTSENNPKKIIYFPILILISI